MKVKPEIGYSVVENEVRRRLADSLAAAGVGHGRISLEVLYMMPPDFVRAYTQLFNRALAEDVIQPGGGGQGDSDNRDENVRKAIKGRARLKPNSKTTMFPNGARAGRRFKVHWIVRDEAAFKVKASVDRKLNRLVREIERELEREKAREKVQEREKAKQIPKLNGDDGKAGNQPHQG